MQMVFVSVTSLPPPAQAPVPPFAECFRCLPCPALRR